MSFAIDKQTLEELNLTGKFRQGSVYGLFNKTKTKGGERWLQQMFNHPLEGAEAINERSSIFRYFQESKPDFPFDVRQLIPMREYLDAAAERSAILTHVYLWKMKGLSLLIRDARLKKIVEGLHATINILNTCAAFVEGLPASGGPYAARIKSIKVILSDPGLQRLRNIDIYQALSVRKLAVYDHLLKSVLPGEMREIMSFIHELDVNIAVGNTARARGFNYARALPAGTNILSVRGLSHPCLDGAVGNDIGLNGRSNVLFLTGANMAGKSTLMKSVGICLYLAHIGFPIAADHMEFSVREGLYSSINVADNIDMGYSHFYAEVVRVKQVAEAAASGKRLLLMFDELFKGTNVKDAYDGTLAVTRAFAEYTECLFIVSTHIIEVGEALKGFRNIQFAFMPTIMEGMRPRYTYRLEAGITEDRQGMMIIRNEGILEMLINKISL